MILTLTDEQVIKMGKLAILASKPRGMGYLHHNPDLREEIIDNLKVEEGGLNIDYYAGRIVKFNAHKKSDTTWSFPDDTSYDYQSWKSIYDSYEKLAEAVI